MTAAYVLNIHALDETAWEAAMRLLPTERTEKAASLRNVTARNQSLGVGLLLRYALTHAGFDPESVCYDGGKPVLRDGSAYISLSHSGNYVACALSEHPIGVDVQDMSEGDPALATRFYHPRELEYVSQYGTKGFYRLWCRKECFVKAFGWREPAEFDTTASASGYEYFDFQPERTVMGCVLSASRPVIQSAAQENLLREVPPCL